MKKTRRILLGTLLGLLVLLAACLLAYYGLQYRQRTRLIASRPLVLIYNPGNQQRISLDEGVIVHASARFKGGVSRIELWVDDMLLARRDNPDKTGASLTLRQLWETGTPGNHLLVVRAFSVDGGEGQATVAVEALEASGEPTSIEVGEGETIDSIAAEYGVSPDELMGLNPGVDPEGVAAGDELVVPGGPGPGAPGEEPEGGPGGGDEGLPPGDDDPPDPEPPPPGDPPVEPVGADEPVAVRLEALRLETGAAYEGVHCYVGLGGSTPRWYPDMDGDQATDESFNFFAGNQRWDVAAHLTGGSAPVVQWPGDQILPVEISCVGVTGGGTEAVELGQVAMRVPPEAWDGVTRQAEGSGGEGSFTLDYRISRVGASHAFPIFEDSAMTPPTNVRIQEQRGFGGSLVRQLLLWDYNPLPEEEPIDGFRVYLNNTMQWVVDADHHATTLPDQWLLPPCGDEYRFTVTAFREGFPDGPESPHSEPYVIRTAEDDPACSRQVLVTFLELKTYDLGGDGEDDAGDVGPVYGEFSINDQIFPFDGRCEGSGICGEVGLYHNSVTDLSRFPWGGNGEPIGVLIDVGEADYVDVGYSISELDTGWNNDDELVCEGDSSTGDLDTPHEGTIPFSPWGQGLCEVTYWIGPVGDRPVTEPGAPPPLPMLRVESLTADAASNQLQIHVTNRGGADWVYQDLAVLVESRSREAVATQTWPSFHLGVGESTILEPAGVTVENLEDFCVTPDPENAVQEEGQPEWYPVFTYCPPLPDLAITDVEYDRSRELLRVRIYNQSLVPITGRNLTLQAYLPDGTPLFSGITEITGRDLAPHTSTLVQWGGFNDAQRERMRGGYTVTVDPEDHIGEEDEGNNQFVVRGGARLRIHWTQISTPYYPYYRYSEGDQEQSFRMQVSVGSAAGSSRQVADWSLEEVEVEHGEILIMTLAVYAGEESEYVQEFDIYGDEWLSVFVDATMKYRLLEKFLGYDAVAFGADEDWGVTKTISPGEACVAYTYHSELDQDFSFHAVHPWDSCRSMRFRFMVCRVE